MNIQHPDSACSGGFACLCDCIWDVVVLQVQEDIEAALRQRIDQARPSNGEQLLADLESTKGRRDASGERKRFLGRRVIQGDDDAWVAHAAASLSSVRRGG